jgi:hypothetical protein
MKKITTNITITVKSLMEYARQIILESWTRITTNVTATQRQNDGQREAGNCFLTCMVRLQNY